jgi:hypothetical protein
VLLDLTPCVDFAIQKFLDHLADTEEFIVTNVLGQKYGLSMWVYEEGEFHE